MFTQFAIGLGSSELEILIWKAKNVAAPWFSSTMALIRPVFVVDGSPRTLGCRLKSLKSKRAGNFNLEQKERHLLLMLHR